MASAWGTPANFSSSALPWSVCFHDCTVSELFLHLPRMLHTLARPSPAGVAEGPWVPSLLCWAVGWHRAAAGPGTVSPPSSSPARRDWDHPRGAVPIPAAPPAHPLPGFPPLNPPHPVQRLIRAPQPLPSPSLLPLPKPRWLWGFGRGPGWAEPPPLIQKEKQQQLPGSSILCSRVGLNSS